MSREQLRARVRLVARRRAWLTGWRQMTRCWLALLGLGLAAGGVSWALNGAVSQTVALSIAGITALGAIAGFLTLSLRTARIARDELAAARLIEEKIPGLEQRLVTALEQHPDPETGTFSYLQRQIFKEALAHHAAHPWQAALPFSRLVRGATLQTATAAICLGVVGLLWLNVPRTETSTPESAVTPAEQSAAPAYVVSVEPGNVSLERGSDLLVLARFDGNCPPSAELVVTRGEEVTRIPLSQNLDDPLFGGRLARLTADATYQIEMPGQTTGPFAITVFDFPAVSRIDARLQYPAYTKLPEAAVAETRRIGAVEGTQVTLTVQVNKPLATARMTLLDGTAVDLTPVANQPTQWTALLPLSRKSLAVPPQAPESFRYQLELTDADGRRNKSREELLVDVLPNLPPELKLTAPGRDLRASPLEELLLAATAFDDFGVQKMGVEFSLAGQPPVAVPLAGPAAARETAAAQHLLALETLGVEPDQLVSYTFWAEDFDAQGQLRRTHSDMYFAEIRHFEEIFRQGEQPPGGGGGGEGGGNAEEAGEAAKAQKEIVNATWKLLRTANPDRASAEAIRDGQQKIMEKTAALKEKLTDPTSQALVDSALLVMQQTMQHLATVIQQPSTPPLTQALSSEQLAYQALLKLHAKEHRVTQGQPGGGGGGGGGSSGQQQLDQLELTNRENRYETERQAGEKQAARQEQQERNDVQSLLRDLARRQAGVNEQLQELDAALQAAAEEAQREELRRQLQRLREEQQELLQDADKLQQKLEKPQNQSQMAESQQKLGETRENIQQASDALEKGQLSQALNSGTRAARDLEQMEEELRRQSAHQFADEMQSLRDQARELARNEADLSNNLKEMEQQGRRSLRSTPARQDLDQELAQQKQRLENLLDEMQDVTTAAETSEPLLSKQLYDALRKSQQDRLGETLDGTRALLQNGLIPEATVAEQQAREGIETLQAGVEKASQNVLGDDLAALRRAREELSDLSKQLKGESPTSAENGNTPAETQLAMADDPPSNARSDSPAPSSNQGQPAAKGNQQNSGEEQKAAGQGRPSGGNQPPADQGQEGQQGQGGQAGASPESKPASPSPPSKSSGSSTGKSPGESQSPGQGQAPGKGPPGQAGGQRSSASEGEQPGEGSAGSGGSSGGSPSPGQSSSSKPGGNSPSTSETPPTPGRLRGGSPGAGQSGGQGGETASGPGGPLTGQEYSAWEDRLRNVEQMLDDEELRNEVARIRDSARGMRIDFQRHAKTPDWDQVQQLISDPLVELERRITEELARRESPESLVPIDRDPIPERYSDLVREYYKQLGRSAP